MKNIKKYTKHIIIGLVSGFLNGLFGSGGGCVVVPAMEKFLDFPPKKAHATAISVILVTSLVSAFLYVRQGFFDFKLWLPVTIGGVIGGIVGAKVLNKLSNKWIRLGFGVVILITAWKMIF